MQKIKISVILPVYNSENYLADCIESILTQTFKNFELIIVNDSSNDRTTELIYFYKKLYKNKIKVINNKKKIGVSKSLNKAVKISSGNYIVRMDSDDICYQNRFEYLLSYMNKNKNIDILFSGMEYFGSKFFFLKHSASRYDNKEIGTLLNYYNPLNHPTFIAKSKVLKKYKYSSRFKNFEDWNLWIVMHKNGEVFQSLDKVLYRYRIHEKQVSKKITEKTTGQFINKNINVGLDNFFKIKKSITIHKNTYFNDKIKNDILLYYLIKFYKRNKFTFLIQLIKIFQLKIFIIFMLFFFKILKRQRVVN